MKKGIDDIFVKRLAAFDPLKALTLAITEKERDVLDLNKQQMLKGEDSEGQDMGQYSTMWAEYKRRYAPVDLKDQGDYHAEMYLVVDREGTRVESNDWKAEKLKEYVEKRTGNEPLGIQKKNILKFKRIILETFQNNFKKEL